MNVAFIIVTQPFRHILSGWLGYSGSKKLKLGRIYKVMDCFSSNDVTTSRVYDFDVCPWCTISRRAVTTGILGFLYWYPLKQANMLGVFETVNWTLWDLCQPVAGRSHRFNRRKDKSSRQDKKKTNNSNGNNFINCGCYCYYRCFFYSYYR